jgi:hypothetical protein
MHYEYSIGPELQELIAKYENTWVGLPEAVAMPRELEGVGGMLGGMVLGVGVGAVAICSCGEMHLDVDSFRLGDHEAVMMFHAGKLAIAVMCGTSPRDYPLAASSVRLVTSIAEEFLGNLPEILRLTRQLKEERQVSPEDVREWTKSTLWAQSVSRQIKGPARHKQTGQATQVEGLNANRAVRSRRSKRIG